MGSLADLFATVRPDLSKLGPELRAGLRPIAAKAGEQLGDGIWRSADGRLRNARGRFVTAGQAIGAAAGKGAGSRFGSVFGKSAEKSGRESGTRFSSAMQGSTKRAMGRGLAAAGIAAGAVFAGALTKGFGRLSAIENAEAKLTGLGHSAKSVDKIMVNALASVKGTAFGLDEAATVAATAVAAGIEPGQKLQRTLKLVADAATIGGTSLNEMGAIFNQVAASNKVQGDTINQLNERGIPILKLLAEVMGVSQAEVAALASKGKIDFATFQKAMEKGLGGAALKSGNTASGAFKNMGAAFSRVGAALLKGVFPQIGAGFGTITKFLDDITPAAARFGVAVGTAFSTVAAFVRDRLVPAFAGIKANVLPGLQVVGDFIRTNVLPALRSLGSFVLTTLLPAWLAWYKFLGSQLVPILKQVGGFVIANIVPAFRTVARFIASDVVPGFLSIVETVKGLIRVVAPIIGQIVGVIIGKFREMGPEVKSIWTSVKEIITGVMFIVKDVIQAVTTIIRLIWDRHGESIKKIVGSAFGAIFKTIAGVMKAIAGIIKLFVALIKGDWSGAWTAIKQIFAGVWQVIKAILGNVLKQIDVMLGGHLGKMKTLWSSFWSGIRTSTSTAINNVRTTISTVLGRIVSAFSTAKANISRVWSGVKGVVSAPIEWVKNNVYNRPLVPVWNRVAGLVGGPKLATYATGTAAADPYGIRPGYTPGRDTHLIGVSGGEPILRPEAGRALGSGWVDGVNRSARTGGVSGVKSFLSQEGLPGFAGGGIAGWIKNKISGGVSGMGDLLGKLKDWALGGLRKAAGAVLSPVKGFIDRNMPGTGVGRTVGGVGKKAIDLILDKIQSSDAAAMATSGAGQGAVPGSGTGSRRLVRWHGGTFTERFRNTLERAQAAAGRYIPVMQGGFRPRTSYSGTSHQGDAVDTLRNAAILSGLRRSGVAAWMRGLAQGMVNHIHGIPLPGFGYPGGSGIWQAQDYLRGGNGLMNGGLVKGGRGGLITRIGEGANDELVTPLPKNWRAGNPGAAALTARPITILIDLGDGVSQRVQGILDENDEFRASVGRMR